MAKKSAGILLYRFVGEVLEVLIVHPGGPFWAKKDKGVWSIPKGEFTDDEDPFEAAKREFAEECGSAIACDSFIELTPVVTKSNKTIYAYATEGDFVVESLQSNTCSVEWPPKSGNIQTIPEVDRAEWCTILVAKEKLYDSQGPLVEELAIKLGKVEDMSPSSGQPALF